MFFPISMLLKPDWPVARLKSQPEVGIQGDVQNGTEFSIQFNSRIICGV